MIAKEGRASGKNRALSSSIRIELDAGALSSTLLVYGAIGVREVSEQAINIITNRGRLQVFGSNLSVSSLAEGVLEVSGAILDIALGSGAKGGFADGKT